jgi:hypothetical protein
MERELWAHSRKDILNRERADGARCASLVIRLLVEDAARATPLEVDVLDLDTALDELAALDRCKARVAELRFFAACRWRKSGSCSTPRWQRRCRTGRRRARGYSSV